MVVVREKGRTVELISTFSPFLPPAATLLQIHLYHPDLLNSSYLFHRSLFRRRNPTISKTSPLEAQILTKMDAPSPLPISSSPIVEPSSLHLASLEPISQTAQISPRPLPSLPTDLKREILSFCDPSTLAKASLVSLAFLEMSSPFLYRDVTIDGWRDVIKLICSRDVSYKSEKHLPLSSC